MRLKSLIFMSMSLFLSGCLQMEAKQNEVRDFIERAERNAPKESEFNKGVELSEKLSSVDGSYYYKVDIQDPFRLRNFALGKSKDKKTKRVGCGNKNLCPNAPKPRNPMFLERYAISQLKLVGILGKSSKSALIQTPDVGTFSVKKGDYLGKNDGKIVVINEDSVVIHEKFFQNGRWEDKKTILILK